MVTTLAKFRHSTPSIQILCITKKGCRKDRNNGLIISRIMRCDSFVYSQRIAFQIQFQALTISNNVYFNEQTENSHRWQNGYNHFDRFLNLWVCSAFEVEIYPRTYIKI